jgi:hypothetical protein
VTVALFCPPAHAGDWWRSLPARAFVVEGGSIGLTAGVMRNTEVARGPFGKLKYPTKYFIIATNETQAPVWIDIEWGFDEKEPPEKLSSKEVKPGEPYMVWRNTFGVVWDRDITVNVKVCADEARTKSLGVESTAMYFSEKEDKKGFQKSFDSTSALPVISGWKEMKHPGGPVEGTSADATLQNDIRLLLWKEESKRHRDCMHDMVRAEGYQPDSSANFARMSEDLRKSGADLVAHGKAHFEKWMVKSCGTISSYEVLILTSAEGGTDFRVEKIGEQPAEGER